MPCPAVALLILPCPAWWCLDRLAQSCPALDPVLLLPIAQAMHDVYVWVQGTQDLPVLLLIAQAIHDVYLRVQGTQDLPVLTQACRSCAAGCEQSSS